MRVDSIFFHFIDRYIPALLQRIKAVKNLSQQNVASHLSRLSQYGGICSSADFDKYHALNLAEGAAREAHRVRDDKATSLDAAVQTLRSHVSVSFEKFQAYFTALFCDKDYTKVLESIARVDRAFKTKPPASSRSPSVRSEPSRPVRRSGVVCFHFNSLPLPAHAHRP